MVSLGRSGDWSSTRTSRIQPHEFLCRNSLSARKLFMPCCLKVNCVKYRCQSKCLMSCSQRSHLLLSCLTGLNLSKWDASKAATTPVCSATPAAFARCTVKPYDVAVSIVHKLGTYSRLQGSAMLVLNHGGEGDRFLLFNTPKLHMGYIRHSVNGGLDVHGDHLGVFEHGPKFRHTEISVFRLFQKSSRDHTCVLRLSWAVPWPLTHCGSFGHRANLQSKFSCAFNFVTYSNSESCEN